MRLLSFSGFVPEQVCDTVRFAGYPGGTGIAHYCSYAAEFIEQVRADESLDGGVFPRSCDSSRAMAGYLADAGKFLWQMHVPARRDRAAAGYLAGHIRRYQKALEGHFGIRITDIAERAALVDERNRALAKLYGSIADISYGDYLEMLHGLLRRPLREQAVTGDLAPSAGGHRVYLVGSFLTDLEVVRVIERSGMNIVGDRLTESKRLFSAPAVKGTGDLYGDIAESMLAAAPSPTQDRFAEILSEDREELLRKEVQGVIFVTQKYCEPYDYLYPVYKKMLDGMGIPSLRAVLSGPADGRRAELSIEAFADII